MKIVFPLGVGLFLITAAAAEDPRILGDVADGSPAAPVPPPVRLAYAPEEILATRVQDAGERQVIVQKVAPIELPPVRAAAIPPAVPAPAEEARPSPAMKDIRMLFVSASVRRVEGRPEETVSFVRYWSRPDAKPVAVWTNADFLWLTGFATFEAEGQVYGTIIAVSEVGEEHVNAIASSHGAEGGLPDFKEAVAAGYIVAEGTPTAEDLAPLEAMLRLHDREKVRLEAAYESRLEASAERARELRENPPEKKDIVLRYWRLDAAGRTGGAQTGEAGR